MAPFGLLHKADTTQSTYWCENNTWAFLHLPQSRWMIWANEYICKEVKTATAIHYAQDFGTNNFPYHFPHYYSLNIDICFSNFLKFLYTNSTFPATYKTIFIHCSHIVKTFSLVFKPYLHLLLNLDEASLHRGCCASWRLHSFVELYQWLCGAWFDQGLNSNVRKAENEWALRQLSHHQKRSPEGGGWKGKEQKERKGPGTRAEWEYKFLSGRDSWLYSRKWRTGRQLSWSI